MKKLLATACFALFGAGAFAQTTQGTMVVSGSVGISNQANERQNANHDYFNFYIGPKIGKFYRDEIEIGVSPVFSFSTNSNRNEYGDTKGKGYTLSLSPYIQKYFPITEKLYFTANAALSVGITKLKHKTTEGAAYENSGSSFYYGLGVTPGLTYFATEKIGLSLNVGGINFRRTHSKNEDTYPVNNDYTDTSFSASLSPGTSSLSFGYFFTR